MTAITDLRPGVLINAPGCPTMLADAVIMQALIDFFNRSMAYRYTPASITVAASTGDYTPTLPTKTEIAWLISAELDDIPITPRLPSSIPVLWETETGAPSAVIRVSETKIGLRRIPDASGKLNVKLALRPASDATTYPDEFHTLYQDVIVAGALYRLYEMPKKPWSASELVMDRRAIFEAGITDAEYRADRGSSLAPARTSLSLIGGR